MNLDKLFSWVTGVVIVFAVVGKLDVLQMWIWRAQAKVVYASRTSTWGSPRFFPRTSKTILVPAHLSRIREDFPVHQVTE